MHHPEIATLVTSNGTIGFARNDVRKKRGSAKALPLFGFLIRYTKIDFMNYLLAGRRLSSGKVRISRDGKMIVPLPGITNSLR